MPTLIERRRASHAPHDGLAEEPAGDEQDDEDDQERDRQLEIGADEVDVRPDQVEADPISSPPTTAPTGESIPPRTAAAKA